MFVCLQHLHLNGFLSRDSHGRVSKLSWFGLPGLCKLITLCSDLRLGWGLKKTCSSPSDLSNGVLHSTYTHRRRVDSRLLVVENQTANLTLGLSFCHNLCCKCPNGSCELIFDIYTSIVFQWYKERFKARCFDPCNCTLKFRMSQRTPKSPFWECECHSHSSKSGVTTYILSCFHPRRQSVFLNPIIIQWKIIALVWTKTYHSPLFIHIDIWLITQAHCGIFCLHFKVHVNNNEKIQYNLRNNHKKWERN
jgi:hypothetical protein